MLTHAPRSEKTLASQCDRSPSPNQSRSRRRHLQPLDLVPQASCLGKAMPRVARPSNPGTAREARQKKSASPQTKAKVRARAKTKASLALRIREKARTKPKAKGKVVGENLRRAREPEGLDKHGRDIATGWMQSALSLTPSSLSFPSLLEPPWFIFVRGRLLNMYTILSVALYRSPCMLSPLCRKARSSFWTPIPSQCMISLILFLNSNGNYTYATTLELTLTDKPPNNVASPNLAGCLQSTTM